MNAQTNNPNRAGENASFGQKLLFGPFSRYAVYAVHTRFDAVQWFVEDAEQEDENTGGPAVIRQADSFFGAIEGLDDDSEQWD